MEETFKARYIDPMIDWSFKRLFGSEVNKDILIEFLKVIFPEFDIKDITYLPSEQLGIMEKDRRAVFDVICRASDGKEFLVEVQRGAQEHFFERALFYTSFPILKQGKKAMAEEERDTKKPWNFQLDGVFFLGILDYKHLEDDRIEHRYWLREGTTGETMTDKLKFVFVEVAKFNKTEDELTTDLDKWLYMLKNLSDLLERPAALRDKIFKRIFDVAEISSLDDEDKKNYINNMQTARDTYNQLEYAKKKGREEGREEGIEKRSREIAMNLLRINLPIQTICEATGLTEEEVAGLKENRCRKNHSPTLSFMRFQPRTGRMKERRQAESQKMAAGVKS